MGNAYLSAMIMSELKIQNQELKRENYILKERIAQLEKMIFSARRERFVPDKSPLQTSLFNEAELDEKQPSSSDTTDATTDAAVVKKTQKKSRKGVRKNEFPAHLKRKTTFLYPEEFREEIKAGNEDENWIKIGEDITETLAYTPATFHVKKTVRPRYIYKKDEDKGVVQAAVPARLIPKGMVDESLIAQLLVEKIQFHTPIHRFAKKIKQLGVDFIQENNYYNWFHKGAESLLPLYHLLQKDILDTAYIQADESRIAVLAKNKKNSSHRGQMWVFFAPTIRATFFNYEPYRNTESADKILANYTGILQSDGYSVYQKISKRKGVQSVFCAAHARRKFHEAQDNAPQLAKHALHVYQQLYQLERRARAEGMTHEQRLQLRKQQAIPILDDFKKWLLDKTADKNLLPKSMIRKAIDYTLKLWDGLYAYTQDGKIEIDNNLVENTIRPLALGRKNYLFAKSHDTAQNLAILYSIIGTCEKNNINTFKYMDWLLRKVAQEKVTDDAVNWLPHRVDKTLFM